MQNKGLRFKKHISLDATKKSKLLVEPQDEVIKTREHDRDWYHFGPCFEHTDAHCSKKNANK